MLKPNTAVLPFYRLFSLILAACLTASCSSPTPIQTAYIPASPLPTLIPTATRTRMPTQTAKPTVTLEPSATPTTTDIPVYITATVWTTEPVVPVLAYHQFAADSGEESNAVKVRLSDFRQQLQDLYDAGFTLISIENWLHGNLTVPQGRRPLVFTMDDLFFNNQITLLDDGSPSQESGIGVLYQFYLEHPDFGLHGALFCTLGDKLYDNPDNPNWELKLAQAIAWVTEHDLIPYNHFYLHPTLDQVSPRDLTWQAMFNDDYLRRLLVKAGREDLIDRLGNIIAVPYGIWPKSQAGIKALLDYTNQEGVELEAVMDIDYIYRPKFMLPPYDPAFDYKHIPRMVAGPLAIEYFVENQDQFPRAEVCQLGPVGKTQSINGDGYSLLVEQAVGDGRCPAGAYAVDGFVFSADGTSSYMLWPMPEPTPTVTTSP